MSPAPFTSRTKSVPTHPGYPRHSSLPAPSPSGGAPFLPLPPLAWFFVSSFDLMPQTMRALTHMTLERQVNDRAPGLFAALARSGTLLWSNGVGRARLETPDAAPHADTQFSIASNTKTFVAVAIMALRDEGKLDLDDDLARHVPESRHPGVSIREMLAHVSGMQREPVGDVWDTLQFPNRTELVQGWNEAERVGRPHSLHHYSNLCFAMLGEVLCRLERADRWFDVVQRRILTPLGLTSTTLGPRTDGPVAGAYFVPPWSDVPRPEAQLDDGAFGAAGALWSTPADLAAWGAFIADPADEVLSSDTVAEMCEPLVISQAQWEQAWGLGLMLWRRDGRTWVGHTGAYPGSITGVFTHRESATTALAWANNSAATSPGTLAIDLGSHLLEHEPPQPQPWMPGTTGPAASEELLGPWFSEGRSFTFTWCQGRLEARMAGQPDWMGPSVFEDAGPDRYRTIAGRERGELLRVDRDEAGQVVSMHWATYLFTRQPLAFGDWLPAHRTISS